MTTNDPLPPAGEVVPRWRDVALPVSDRVDALLAEMMLAEASQYGLGHLTRVYGSRPVTVEEGAAQLVGMQHTVLRGSRLGIPALVHEECLTGLTAYGATVYPAPIAWAATFDPDLVRRLGAAIGRDLRAVGVHQGLAPVLIQAFLPGQQGAVAIAGVLSGRVNPGGKLPVQIPSRPGGQPGTYLHPPLGGNSHGISSIDPTPLFPFGYGGSYTTFQLDDLATSATEIPTDAE